MGFNNCLCALSERDLEGRRDPRTEVANHQMIDVAAAGQAGWSTERIALLGDRSNNGTLGITSQTRTSSRIPKWASYTAFCIVVSVAVVVGIEVYGAIGQHSQKDDNSTQG